MWKRIIFFCCWLTVCPISSFAQVHPDSLLARREYFKLERYLTQHSASVPEKSLAYYRAVLANFFNRPTQSAAFVESFRKNYGELLQPRQHVSLLEMQIDNMIKLFRYKEATRYSQILLAEYKEALKPEELADLENTSRIWQALSEEAAQKTGIRADTQIPFTRDLAGLINVKVTSDNKNFHDFVFDTGANLSVVSESYATQLSIRKLPGTFRIHAVTGLEVEAGIGICPKFEVSGILVTNAVFIIFPDEALEFGGGIYKINGILGFPVISQWEEIAIHQEGYLFVPRVPQARELRNFGLEQLIPVVELVIYDDSLAFTYDTGAQVTLFNVSFFQKYQDRIRHTGEETEVEFGGAGGHIKVPAYKLSNLAVGVGGHATILDEVYVKTTSTMPNDAYYFGNMGRDLMEPFGRVVMNFKYMYIDFIR